MRKIFRQESLPAWVGPSAPVRQESRPQVHAEVADWALRAAARNGFGGEPMPVVDSQALQPAARHRAHAGLSAIVARGLRRAHALMRLMRRRLRQASQLRCLQSLDAAALRDLGLHRSELGSVHAELFGRASPTRRLVVEHEWVRLRGGIAADHWASR